jgi:radical SAM protein with 4Fe4S-binding SPASM domain
MIRKHFEGYNFVGVQESGVTFRWGSSFNEDPKMAPWPELADISISNYCTNGCSYCYRDSGKDGKFMSIDNYKLVLKNLTSEKYGSIFQIAIGGGEPLLHPNFHEIIQLTWENGIIPNYTTSGKFFNQENIESTRKYCGAVAISWDPYRDLSIDELSELGNYLKNEGIKANIHYVISEKTIQKAMEILNGNFDDKLGYYNSIIFLTHKPVGRALKSDSIKSEDKLKSLIKLIETPVTGLKVGFDACFVPVLIKTSNINIDLVDSCECGFFSVYINEDLDVTPCSFCNSDSYHYNLKEFSFEEIWNHKFTIYRDFVAENSEVSCNGCKKNSECRGKCPFFDELFLCKLIV